MKIASWNVNSLNVRLPQLQQWLGEFAPDVVGLQETKLEDHRFPDDALAALGYRSVFHGQKTTTASPSSPATARWTRCRSPSRLRGRAGARHRRDRGRHADRESLRGQRPDIGTEKYDYKLRWLDAVHGWIADELRKHPKLVVLGDFNIAPDDRDVHDPAVWNDGQHPHLQRRARGAAARCSRWACDGFRLHNDEAGVFSWWDYRQAAFRRNLGLRIDLTLVSEALRASTASAGIDRTRAPGNAPATTRRCGSSWQPDSVGAT